MEIFPSRLNIFEVSCLTALTFDRSGRGTACLGVAALRLYALRGKPEPSVSERDLQTMTGAEEFSDSNGKRHPAWSGTGHSQHGPNEHGSES